MRKRALPIRSSALKYILQHTTCSRDLDPSLKLVLYIDTRLCGQVYLRSAYTADLILGALMSCRFSISFKTRVHDSHEHKDDKSFNLRKTANVLSIVDGP